MLFPDLFSWFEIKKPTNKARTSYVIFYFYISRESVN